MPTLVSAMNSSKLLIQLGDGASPETFAHPCMINTSRGIEFTNSPTEALIPYCPPDEDLPGWIERESDSNSATITGAGMFDSKSLDTFWNWFEGGASKTIHVYVNVGASPGDSPASLEAGYWNGLWVLNSFSVQGPGRREKVTFDCTILSDGPITWVVAT